MEYIHMYIITYAYLIKQYIYIFDKLKSFQVDSVIYVYM